jgi:hypothetical protein
MKNKFKIILTGLILVLFYSCKKKIIEIIPVIEYEDISIPKGGDIKYFSFPTENVGYAADSSKLFKTINGGASWTTLNLSNITSLEFTDDHSGWCTSNGDAYQTLDGGETWAMKIEGDFLDISENGSIVVADCHFPFCNILVSTDNGNSFQYKGNLSYNYYSGGITKFKVFGNRAFIVDHENYTDGEIDCLELVDSTRFYLKVDDVNVSENINDIYIDGANSCVVGGQGYIGPMSFEGYNAYSNRYYMSFGRLYYGHTYQYNSIDGYAGLLVAVGDHTIASNIDIKNDEKWNEVFDKNRNGFEQTFYKIRFFSKETFFVSGKNGLLWRAKI